MDNGLGTGHRKLVLGFDGGCMTCSNLAERIRDAVGDNLEIRSLHDPQVEHWRKRILGENAPWTPTLIEVKGTEVKAWTGIRMGIHLGYALGFVASWRVMRVLGDFNASRRPQELHTSTGAIHSVTRGQFLKGLGGATVALSLLSGLSTLAAAQEGSSSSNGTRAQRAKAEKVVRSSKQFRDLERKLGRKFEFERAKFSFDESLEVATVAVPTAITNGTGAAATFLIELQNKVVSYYRHMVSDRGENGGYKIAAYENGESLGQTLVKTNYIVTPDGRRFTRKQFKEEASRLERVRRREQQEMVFAQTSCSECRRRRYNRCTFSVTTSCFIGGWLNPAAGAICAYVYWYGTTISDGCASWARSTCYKDGYC